MENSNTVNEKLSFRLKMLFSTGDLSTSIPLAILMFFQLYFLTDVAGLRPDRAGWAVAIGRVWDSINDPLFGLLSDRIRSRWGRRRVVLLFGAIPLGFAFMLMWLVPVLDELGMVIYYAATFILFDTMFTLIHVSYNSLTPELTKDYDERSSLNGYRMVYSISGTLASIILVTVLGWYISNPRVLYMIVGIGLGIISMIPPLVVFKVTSERNADELPKPMPVVEAIKTTLSNRPFWMIMGLYLFSWTAASIMAAVLVYFANYYLQVPDQANYFVLLAQASAILFIPLWVWISKKLDKKRAFILGTITWIVVLLILTGVRSDQITLTYIIAALSGSGIAVAYVMPWAMIPDIVELDEIQTGQRREGSFYAFASFFQKLGTGFAIWLMGQVLAMTGYITPVLGEALPVQPPEAVEAIRLIISVVPAVLLFISILFAWRYPVSRESHHQLREQLAHRLDEK
jgi:GPH family glycoside/pentoside/hexuronide:cation symporter